MLTEYNGDVFNAEIVGDKVNIWKYIPVEGFQEKRTRRGVVYYEKSIDLQESDGFFTVSFMALIEDRIFVIDSVENDNLIVLCDDREYAENNGFFEMERGVWAAKISNSSFEEYKLIKVYENNDKKICVKLSYEQMMAEWKKYNEGLNI